MWIAKPFAAGALVCLVACGGGGGGSTPPGVPSRFLYTSAYAGPNEHIAAIYGFAVYSSGALTPVLGSPAPTYDGGGPIAITRDSKFLYTTYPSGVVVSQIQADGSLQDAPVGPFTLPQVPWAVGLVAHPKADFLYASWFINELTGGVLTVYAIDSATGALSLKSSVPNEFYGLNPVMTSDGRYLYMFAQDPTSAAWQIAGFSADAATGALSSVPGSPLSPTTEPNSSATMMAVDPTGKFLYAGYQFIVPNVGWDGRLDAYSIDAASGALTALPGSPFNVGGAPTSVAVDASGRFLIVGIVPRGAGTPENCLVVLSIDPGSGMLNAVPGSPFGPNHYCGFVAADPSEPYVYAGMSSGGANSPATVFVLSIDQATGALAQMGEATIPDDKIGVSFMALTH